MVPLAQFLVFKRDLAARVDQGRVVVGTERPPVYDSRLTVEVHALSQTA